MVVPCKLPTHKFPICTHRFFTVIELVGGGFHAICEDWVHEEVCNDLKSVSPIQSHGVLSLVARNYEILMSPLGYIGQDLNVIL